MIYPIQDLLRAQGVKRWNIVETTRPSSLAEHSFNVAMIVRAIWIEYLGMIGSDITVRTYQALFHDIEELYHGDVPTPGKYDGENGSVPWKVPSSREEYVLKLADLIEQKWFLSEFGSGRHAGEIVELLHQSLIDYPRFVLEEWSKTFAWDAAQAAREIGDAANRVESQIAAGDFNRHPPGVSIDAIRK